MPRAPNDPVSDLELAIASASRELAESDEGGAAPALERPPRAELGDYSSNAAMLLAGSLGDNPRSIAERLVERLGVDLGGQVDRLEVAGPGFVNFFLSDSWYRDAAAAIAESGEDIGRSARPGAEAS